MHPFASCDRDSRTFDALEFNIDCRNNGGYTEDIREKSSTRPEHHRDCDERILSAEFSRKVSCGSQMDDELRQYLLYPQPDRKNYSPVRSTRIRHRNTVRSRTVSGRGSFPAEMPRSPRPSAVSWLSYLWWCPRSRPQGPYYWRSPRRSRSCPRDASRISICDLRNVSGNVQFLACETRRITCVSI